jgi:nitric oxide reductase subunit B
MAQLNHNKTALCFILLSLISLLGGALFGCIAALQFVYPDFAQFLPFFKNRPLHVSLVIAWIFLSSIGGIYYYLPTYCKGLWQTFTMQKTHLILFIITGICILSCYCLGIFGGREYWEYPPVFSLFILVTWIIFAINFFLSVRNIKGPWPVYIWMWATGVVFFIITFSESNLWLLPAIRNDSIRDVTIQWKAYGSLIGSWNMLVYGTGIFLMERISGNPNLARSKSSFLLYILGLINLLFGWAHHIYVVPINPIIRNISYLVSMSEWILLFRIIYTWRKNVSKAQQHIWLFSFRFILTSDVWVFLNIILALLISIPAINVYTHGTHITVAHAMGSTIGINTMILLASCFFIAKESAKSETVRDSGKQEFWGWVILNVSLLFFWLILILAGVKKGVLTAQGISFEEIMIAINPYMKIFAFTGIGIFAGLCLLLGPLLINLSKTLLIRHKDINN